MDLRKRAGSFTGRALTTLCVLVFLVITMNKEVNSQHMEEKNKAPALACTLALERSTFTMDSRVIAVITLKNTSAAAIELRTIPALKCDNRYWCPIDLARDNSPLQVNERSLISLKSGDSRTIHADISRLRWEKTISSVWPAKNFFTVIPTGRHTIVLEIDTEGACGRVCSGSVEFSIGPPTE